MPLAKSARPAELTALYEQASRTFFWYGSELWGRGVRVVDPATPVGAVYDALVNAMMAARAALAGKPFQPLFHHQPFSLPFPQLSAL